MSRRNCAVVGCSNNSIKNAGLHFYSFPTRNWLKEKREKWITAIRRKNKDGSLWKPTRNSCICSTHFIGGLKSEDPMSPSYLPTIFPKQYKMTKQNDKSVSRYERHKFRLSRNDSPDIADTCLFVFDETNSTESTHILSNDTCGRNSVHTQTTPIDNSHNRPQESYFFVENDGNNVGIQTIIKSQVIQVSAWTMTSVNSSLKPINSKDACCGPDVSSSLIARDLKLLDSVPVQFSINSVSDVQLKQTAGVTKTVFLLLQTLLTKSKSNAVKINPANRLYLFLMKLKLGVSNTVLSVIFKIDRTQVQNIFIEILKLMSASTQDWVYWPSREAVKATLPLTFQDFKSCRAIIDCTEIRVEKPASVEQQVYFYSDYKSTHTIKFLIAIAPNGMITFLSKCYGGRATDCYITQHSGFLKLIERNDLILADKGFPHIKTDVENSNGILVMPPFYKGSQFEREEVEEGYKIAKVRVHVERVIQRVKLYKILEKVKMNQLPYIDEIIRFCCVLCNLQPPIL